MGPQTGTRTTNMGYYDSNHETSSEIDGGGLESEELLGESHNGNGNGNEANNTVGYQSHEETDVMFPTSCFPNSQQHALQPQPLASMTSDLPPNYQPEDNFSCATANNGDNNFFVGQNEDNQHKEGDYDDDKGQEKHQEGTTEDNRVPPNITPVAAANAPEDYNIDGRDNVPVSHHSIYHSQNQEETVHIRESSQHDLQNAQMPKNMTWVNQEASKESEQVTIAEHPISPHRLVNLPADAISDQDISSCDKRDGSHSGNSLNAFENKQAEEKGKRRRNEITLEEIQSLFGMREDDAAMALGVSVPTIKRRCRDLGIERWPKKKMSAHHFTKKRKASSKSPSKSEYSQHVVERLDLYETPRERRNGANPSTLSNSVQKRGSSCSYVVKATYIDNTVRFVSTATTILELKEQVADNLELEPGKKFKIKYEDGDKEWLLMTKNEHLEYARSLPDSSGNNFLRLFIINS